MKRLPNTAEATFYSDKACRKGHVGLKYILGNRCVQCARDRVARHYRANPEPVKKRAAQHRLLAESKRRRKAWYRANAKSVIAKTGEWGNVNRESRRVSSKKYQKNNLARYRVWNAKREERVRRATPSWADQSEIAKFYVLAQKLKEETGVLYSVDHVIPLQGGYVCGLHIADNLQVIPLIENCRKSNAFDVLAA